MRTNIEIGDGETSVTIPEGNVYDGARATDIYVNGVEVTTVWTYGTRKPRTLANLHTTSVDVMHVAKHERSIEGEGFVALLLASKKNPDLSREVQAFLSEEDARNLRDALLALDLGDRETAEA